MRFSLLFAIILLVSINGVIRSRFRALKCTPLNETVASFKYCYLRAYSRSYVSMNWGITRHLPFDRPLDVFLFDFDCQSLASSMFQVKIKIMYRYGNIYREVLHTEFEWCGLVDGTSNNVVANAFAKLLKAAAPQMFQPCPFPTVSRFFVVTNCKSFLIFRDFTKTKIFLSKTATGHRRSHPGTTECRSLALTFLSSNTTPNWFLTSRLRFSLVKYKLMTQMIEISFRLNILIKFVI